MGALGAAGVALAPMLSKAQENPKICKPNLVVILVDDMGYSDAGFMGGEIKTPNLDRLAREGIVMTRAVNCAVCSPTRTSLLTGTYSHKAGYPRLAGRLDPEFPMLPEMLADAGYSSYMSGKWHLKPQKPEERGFERFFGFLHGCTTHWDDVWARSRHSRPRPESGLVYSSDAIADNAIAFLKENEKTNRPFFLYYSFTAPHYPIHAPRELIDLYESQYRAGWDGVRQTRWERQQRIGFWPATAQLPDDRTIGPRFQEAEWANQPVPAWDSLPPDRRADLTRRMAVHAAMVDQIDVNIGRLLDYLRASGQLDNTVIFFASDNGCSAQGGAFGGTYKSGRKPNRPLTGPELEKLGGPDSNETLGAGWARASNAPLRYSKAHAHAGGNVTPLLIWGRLVRERAGQYDATPCHVIDIAPTCLGLAAGEPPSTGFDGVSLDPVFRNESLPERTLFFELSGEKAIVTPSWRAVKTGRATWELYDEKADPTETTDLAGGHPDAVKDLAAAHAAWMKSMAVRTPSVEKPQESQPEEQE